MRYLFHIINISLRADGLIREPLILEFVGNVNEEMKSEIVKYMYIYIYM